MAENRNQNQNPGQNQNQNQGQGQNRGGNQNRGNPAGNISQQDKIKGGQHSAEQQTRDDQGQFAGKEGQGGGNRGGAPGRGDGGNMD